eukprot:5614670-Pleurochrysis_carterae.AAC.1
MSKLMFIRRTCGFTTSDGVASWDDPSELDELFGLDEDVFAAKKSQRSIRRLLHPDFKEVTFTTVPSDYSINKASFILRDEENAVAARAGLKGATMSFSKTLLGIISMAKSKDSLTQPGTASEPLKVLCAGDGFQIAAKRKAVRCGVMLISAKGLHQSPHDWLDYLHFEGSENYVELQAYFEPLFEEIQEVSRCGYVEDEAGVRYYVELWIGGDKPWILAFLGHRNMNFRFPFPYCDCPQSAANNFDLPLDGHMCIDATIAAEWAHVCAKHHYFKADWKDFPCRCGDVACEWSDQGIVTQASRQSFREKLAAATDSERYQMLKNFAIHSKGFDFDHPPTHHYHFVAPDPLHAYLNLMAPVFKRWVHELLQYDKMLVHPEVKEVKESAGQCINTLCKPLNLQYTLDDEAPRINGNTVKAILGTPGFLSGIVRAITPVVTLTLPIDATRLKPAREKASKEKARPSSVRSPEGAATASEATQAQAARRKRGKQKPTRILAALNEVYTEPGLEAAAAASDRPMPTPVASHSAMKASDDAVTSTSCTSQQQQETNTSTSIQSELIKMLEARVEIRLATFFECCIVHWSYMTAKDYDADDAATR